MGICFGNVVGVPLGQCLFIAYLDSLGRVSQQLTVINRRKTCSWVVCLVRVLFFTGSSVSDNVGVTGREIEIRLLV